MSGAEDGPSTYRAQRGAGKARAFSVRRFFFLYRRLVFFIVKSVCLFRFIVLLYVYCK